VDRDDLRDRAESPRDRPTGGSPGSESVADRRCERKKYQTGQEREEAAKRCFISLSFAQFVQS